MFILDTDVLSNLRKKRPHPNLLRWMDEVGWDELATTAITIMEIQVGIERAQRSSPETAAGVRTWLDGLLAVGQPQVLPLDTDAALILGKLRETPALRGFVLPDPRSQKTSTDADLAIAAIACANQAVVTTNNVRDFLAINAVFPLPGLFSPFDGVWSAGDASPSTPPRLLTPG